MRRLAAVLVVLMLGLMAAPAWAQAGFEGLRADQRVYDLTGSLTPDQSAGLQQRLDTLARDQGADVVVVVRALDADPAETLDQVENLQQAWAKTTGRSQDTAVGILINREPGKKDKARAGIFLGTTYDDGNVPRGEQEKIVSDALIPPLRDGDVAGSLTAGLDRLSSDLVNGPPKSGFQTWAEGAVWVPYVLLALALAGALGGWQLFERRETAGADEPAPTLVRPGRLEPAVAGALAAGGASSSTVPAVVLALAARGALSFEPEGEKKLQVRLGDGSLVRGKVEQTVWDALVKRAEDGVVGAGKLGKVASGATSQAVVDELKAHGWWNPRAKAALAGLIMLGAVAAIVAVFAVAVTVNGLGLLGLLGIVPLVVVSLSAFVAAGMVSNLSRTGGREALGWKAYRAGLKSAAKDPSTAVDLDSALPDLVAFGLGGAYKDRLKDADLIAFRSMPGHAGIFPWVVFSAVFASSSGASGMVSGGGAGGGGGAAGGT